MAAQGWHERRQAEAAPLVALRRRRRRFSSLCFFFAGIAFGTALYLVRAHFDALSDPRRRAVLFSLVGLLVALFWLGARAETEVSELDERLRELRTRPP